MNQLERFKQLSEAIPTNEKFELYQQFAATPEAGIERIIELAASQGLWLDKAAVSALIKAIDNDDGFKDVDLGALALAAMSGGNTAESST